MTEFSANGMTQTDSIEAQRLLSLYSLNEEDLGRIQRYGERAAARLGTLVDRFYEWLERQPDFPLFFTSPEKLVKVKDQQREYWREFMSGQVDEAYVARRRLVGETHARIGLSLDTYLAAMNRSLQILLELLHEDGEKTEEIPTAVALTKLLHLDLSIVVGTFNMRTQAIITEQTESLLQMSTPVTRLWDDVLLLPIVGIIDSKRANEIMNSMLSAIAQTQAKASILDIRGVAVVDTAVANHLIKITKATKLMGCECTISGISPAIAQTMVELGIEVGDIHTTATLGDALRYAFTLAGISIIDARASGGHGAPSASG
jgi:rsbT co-antagonist protein RsbR